MKLWSGIVVLGLLCAALAEAKPQLIVAPLDGVALPKPAGEWKLTVDGPEGLVLQLTHEAPREQNHRVTALRLKRLPLQAAWRGNWQAGFMRQLKTLQPQAKLLDKNATQLSFQAEQTQNYMPVQTASIVTLHEPYLYIWECQRQEALNTEASLAEWCRQTFEQLRWPEQQAYQGDVGAFSPRWARFAFDRPGLLEAREKLLRHFNAPGMTRASLADLIGLDLLASLYTETALSQVMELQQVEQLIVQAQRFKLSELLPLLVLHRAYLQQDTTRLERELTAYLGTAAEPPYYLLSRWVRGINPTAALDFAQRAVLAAKTDLTQYTLAAQLQAMGRGEESLAVVPKQDNALVWQLRAELASAQRDPKATAQLLDKAQQRDPSSMVLQLSRARLLQAQGADYEAIQRIYEQLNARKDLSAEQQVRVCLAWAEFSLDPEQKINLYQRALTLQPKLPEAYYALGKVYLLEKHEKSQALSQFKHYIKQVPATDPKARELRQLIAQVEYEL